VFETVETALARPHPCPCDCFRTLDIDERTRGVEAMYRFDDAMHGWGYQPLYEPTADKLYRIAQARNDAGFRAIPVRDGPCVYRRLVGFAVHEIIHAVMGDTSKANYGIPWGAPYGVPLDVLPGDEARFLAPFNKAEAMAFIGVGAVAEELFGIDWTVYTARDVGTYGFPGGNAIVPCPTGFRPVPHYDSVHHPSEYYALARALEREARKALDDTFMTRVRSAFEAAEARGASRKKPPRPSPSDVALVAPRMPGRNDLCLCGSAKKYKKCCGSAA